MECLCLGNIGLIVAPWKFDVPKTSIFAFEASWANICFNNIKFPRDNYRAIFLTESLYCLNSTLPKTGENTTQYWGKSLNSDNLLQTTAHLPLAHHTSGNDVR